MDDHDVSALLVMVTDKRRPSDRAKMEKEGEERKGKERRREQRWGASVSRWLELDQKTERGQELRTYVSNTLMRINVRKGTRFLTPE